MFAENYFGGNHVLYVRKKLFSCTLYGPSRLQYAPRRATHYVESAARRFQDLLQRQRSLAQVKVAGAASR